MRYYTRILPFENDRRLRKLGGFRELIVGYFNNCTYEMFKAIENEQARRLRIEINTSLDETLMIVNAAGVSTQILYQPAPIRGGFAGNIDVFLNIFSLPYYEINPQVICDHLERAIGIYKRNRRAAWFRLFNPFYYLGRILDYISEFPFLLLGRMGFNRRKAEASVLGRIIKGLVQLFVFLAAVFAVLKELGYMDAVKVFIRGLF